MPFSAIILEKRGNLSFVIQANQGAVKVPLSIERFLQPDMYCISCEPLVIRLLEQFPIKSRRSHLKQVSMRDQIFYIENQPYPLTDSSAVVGADSSRLVDKDPQGL
jgi:hypothetical protein